MPTTPPELDPELFGQTPEEQRRSAEAFIELVPALPAPPVAPARRAQLLAAVAGFPLRYGPFFERLAEFWDVSEAAVEARLGGLGPPEAWPRAPLPGVSFVDIEPGPRLAGATVRLARFAPWFRFPKHRHLGPEAVFVLEGSYRDSSGIEVGAGELQRMEQDTEHGFAITGERHCVATLVQYGMEFSSGLLRTAVRAWSRFER